MNELEKARRAAASLEQMQAAAAALPALEKQERERRAVEQANVAARAWAEALDAAIAKFKTAKASNDAALADVVRRAAQVLKERRAVADLGGSVRRAARALAGAQWGQGHPLEAAPHAEINSLAEQALIDRGFPHARLMTYDEPDGEIEAEVMAALALVTGDSVAARPRNDGLVLMHKRDPETGDYAWIWS